MYAFRFVYFQEKSLHFAPFCLSSLVANSYFFKSNYPLFTPKIPLFNDDFAFSDHIFHGSKGFCLCNRSVFLCLSPRILHHFTLRFAPFYLAFSTKTHCILHQNALRLAAYCTAFSTKTHFILLQIAQKRVLVAVCLNKNSFCLHAQLTPFCTKTTSARIDFLRQGGRLVGRKGTHDVKNYAEKLTDLG